MGIVNPTLRFIPAGPSGFVDSWPSHDAAIYNLIQPKATDDQIESFLHPAIPRFYQSSSMLLASSLAPIAIPTSIQHLGHTLQNTALISSTVPNSAPHCACLHLADAIDESYHADGLGHKVPYDGIRLPYNRHALLALGSVTRRLMMGSGCLVTGMPNKAQMTFPTYEPNRSISANINQ